MVSQQGRTDFLDADEVLERTESTPADRGQPRDGNGEKRALAHHRSQRLE